MLAETPGERISLGEDPFCEFAEVFRKVDLAIGNLECVVATTGKEYDKTLHWQRPFRSCGQRHSANDERLCLYRLLVPLLKLALDSTLS